jgi:hypothetical protein
MSRDEIVKKLKMFSFNGGNFNYVDEEESDNSLFIRFETFIPQTKTNYFETFMNNLESRFVSKHRLDKNDIHFDWDIDCEYSTDDTDDCLVFLMVSVYVKEDDFENTNFEEWVEESNELDPIFKKGDLMICVNPGTYSNGRLTKGKVYKALSDTDINNENLIYVELDRGNKDLVFSKRFILKDEPEETNFEEWNEKLILKFNKYIKKTN